ESVPSDAGSGGDAPAGRLTPIEAAAKARLAAHADARGILMKGLEYGSYTLGRSTIICPRSHTGWPTPIAYQGGPPAFGAAARSCGCYPARGRRGRRFRNWAPGGILHARDVFP